MAHMVIFQTPDGNPGYNQFDTVEAAVGFVEQLRNEQGVSNARMFALEELKFDFKAYYRVEMAALTAGDPPAAAAPSPAAPPSAAAPAPPLQVVPPTATTDAPPPPAGVTDDLSSPVGNAPVGEDGEPQLRRGLFGR